MGRSKETFGKKNVRDKKAKKRKEKERRKEERKEEGKKGFDDMIAYVDENGEIMDEPPEQDQKQKVDAESIEVSIPKQEKQAAPEIRSGVVDFFDDRKGFGFIQEDNSSERYFCHVSGLVDEIVEGDKVSFKVKKGAKGMDAYNVKVVH